MTDQRYRLVLCNLMPCVGYMIRSALQSNLGRTNSHEPETIQLGLHLQEDSLQHKHKY